MNKQKLNTKIYYKDEDGTVKNLNEWRKYAIGKGADFSYSGGKLDTIIISTTDKFRSEKRIAKLMKV